MLTRKETPTCPINRRQFLRAATLYSAIGVAPAFLTRTATGARPVIEGFKDDRVLVVLQLGGGNDGLNTVAPYAEDAYYRARPTLGLKADHLIRLNDHLALNNNLQELMRLYDNGKVAIVQGVGYPNPDRSHFRSMEIWHTASDSDEYLGAGWIGRYFDNCCSGSARPQVGVALGRERPQAFDGARGLGVTFERPEQFGWMPGPGDDTPAHFARMNSGGASGNDTLDFLRHTTSSAIMSAKEVHEAIEKADYRASAGPGGRRDLDALQTVAALIRGGLATRIYYVSMSGFDTHANQLGAQDNLLQRFAQAVAKFQQTLERDGAASRVLTLVFSEFGRRVEENASRGTDHGTAAPMFLIGNGVKPGLHGTAPDLQDLDNGDLKHSIDFRAVYAAVLEKWFGVDSTRVLQHQFPVPNLLA